MLFSTHAWYSPGVMVTVCTRGTAFSPALLPALVPKAALFASISSFSCSAVSGSGPVV